MSLILGTNKKGGLHLIQPEGQRFKFYSWKDVAGDKLLIDTEYRQRQAGQ